MERWVEVKSDAKSALKPNVLNQTGAADLIDLFPSF